MKRALLGRQSLLESRIWLRLMFLLTVSSPSFGAQSSEIRDFDFKDYLLRTEAFQDCPERVKEVCKNSSDANYCPSGLSIKVTYADLTGDQKEEAIVQGSSCNTGTAGPDIHSVYERTPQGKVRELSVPRADKRAEAVLFGNQNYDLTVSEGNLLAVHYDTSGRKNPLVIKYQWKNSSFQIESMEAAPTYKTSYDCSKAKAVHERAICSVEELAKLDLRLDELYRRTLKSLGKSQKQRLIQEQKEWIAARNRSCTIYKWWVECLHKTYQERISEFEKKL